MALTIIPLAGTVALEPQPHGLSRRTLEVQDGRDLGTIASVVAAGTGCSDMDQDLGVHESGSPLHQGVQLNYLSK
jgi:hypothetical protein